MTSGLAVYAPLPEGLYFVNFATSGTRTPNGTVNTTYDVPFFIYQSPFKILGGGLEFVVAPTYLAYKHYDGTANQSGLFNTYLGAQISWDLGGGFSTGYRLAGYIPQSGSVALDYGTIDQRTGISYTKDGFDLTLNLILGILCFGLQQ